MKTSEVHWIGGGEVTEAQLRFLVGSSGANDMLREELSRLQQPLAHQENTNNNTSTEEVCWIGDGEPTEEQIRFLVGTGANDALREELALLQQTQVQQEDAGYPIDIHGKEANKNLESTSSSFDPTAVVKVVLDEIVDTVMSRESNHATSDQIDHTTAKYQEEKILVPVPLFTVVHKSLHFALQWSEDEVDRLTSPFNKKKLMSREDHADLCGSIEGIHEYLQKTIESDNIKEYASGLEKLLNGGHITNDQAKAYKKQYNIG